MGTGPGPMRASGTGHGVPVHDAVGLLARRGGCGDAGARFRDSSPKAVRQPGSRVWWQHREFLARCHPRHCRSRRIHIAGATTKGCLTKAASPMFPSWPYPPSVLQQDPLARLWLDTAESDGDAARVRLCGELDITTVDRSRPMGRAAAPGLPRTPGHRPLSRDLLRRRGLSALTTLHRTLRSGGRRLTLHNVPMAVRRIMAITGDDRDLDIA